MQLMTKEPMRALGPSCCENRGTPIHRQNMPDKMVPIIRTREVKGYSLGHSKWTTHQVREQNNCRWGKTRPNTMASPVWLPSSWTCAPPTTCPAWAACPPVAVLVRCSVSCWSYWADDSAQALCVGSITASSTNANSIPFNWYRTN